MEDLKMNLFEKCRAELEDYIRMDKGFMPVNAVEKARQYGRFLSLIVLIEDSGLEAEYEIWRESHPIEGD